MNNTASRTFDSNGQIKTDGKAPDYSEYDHGLSDNPDHLETSDYSEFSGDDNQSFSSPSDGASDSENVDNITPNLLPQDRRAKKLVEGLLKSGHKGPEILAILSQKYGIKLLPQTFSCKRKEWALRRCDLGPAPIPVPLSPDIRASIFSSQSKGLNLKEMQAHLYKETGVNVHCCTVQRYLKKLGIQLLPNDLLNGKITIDQVFAAINDARGNLLKENTGYRRMRMILMRHYDIRIPR
ncbi:hypothetical protein PtA15_7A209 [Puccinia triticina]|nr:uncharacterized protein PtA15_7A209 [Puccinia triticina]WAQ86483.1 hypothetical protein PtA15_7A209 [Puccinia triticina]